jgi:hypothetical protein
MKKTKLDIAALNVISFEPAPRSDARGTVKGRDSGLGSGFFTCIPDATCGTCGYSCEPGSCDYTCDVPRTGVRCDYC